MATQAQHERATVPLWLKLALFTALFALVPVLVVALLLLQNATESLQNEAESIQQRAIAEVLASLRSSFEEPQFLQELYGEIFTDASLLDEEVDKLLLKVQSTSISYRSISLYNSEGGLEQTLQAKGAAKETLTTLPKELRDAAVQVGLTFGEPSLVEGEVLLPLVLPLKTPGGGTLFTMSRVSLAEVQKQIERFSSEELFRDAPDAIFLLDGSQRVVAHTDPAARLRPLGDHELLRFASPKDQQIQISSSYERGGVPHYGTIGKFEYAPFYAVVQLPESIIYEKANRLRMFVYLVLGVTALLSLAAALLLSRGLTAPIRQLAAFAKDLAARRFHKRLVMHRRDELGLLGSTMSQAAADLEASEAQIRREQEIRSDLGRYLPKDLVDLVVKREQKMELGGERRTISVLFADVVSFTPLAEKRKPEEAVAILNQLFTILTEIVFRHGGTVDKFMGDCVMAFFGAPKEQPDHAARALRTAEDMLKWLDIGNADWEKRYGVKIQLAIGVNTGEAIVGNIGSETRMEYTAIGDTVNIAARLESIAQPQQILLTRATEAATEGEFDLSPLGHKTLSGRQGSIEIFELTL